VFAVALLIFSPPILVGGVCKSAERAAQNIEDTTKEGKKTVKVVRLLAEEVLDFAVELKPYAIGAAALWLSSLARRRGVKVVQDRRARKASGGSGP
jgi:N-acetylmuramic acid 6-phosphate (MurNAc-6-P) etherase